MQKKRRIKTLKKTWQLVIRVSDILHERRNVVVSSSVDTYLLHIRGNQSPDVGVRCVTTCSANEFPASSTQCLCVSLTCVFAALAALDEAEDEQYEHQQHDGADESNQPTPGGKAPGNLRWH